MASTFDTTTCSPSRSATAHRLLNASALMSAPSSPPSTSSSQPAARRPSTRDVSPDPFLSSDDEDGAQNDEDDALAVSGSTLPAQDPENLAVLADQWKRRESMSLSAGERDTRRSVSFDVGRGSGEREPLLGSSDEEGLREEDDRDRSARKRLGRPGQTEKVRERTTWWRRPSIWWLVPCTLLSSISGGMTLPPAMELKFQLVCRTYLPLPAITTSIPPLMPLYSSTIPNPSSSSSSYPFTPHHLFFHAARTLADPPPNADPPASPPPEWLPNRAKQAQERCTHVPEVQSTVAKLNSAQIIIAGVLGALTTGWYGALSDRRGRTKVLALSLVGNVMLDAIYVFVVYFPNLPGSYWNLLIGSVISGVLGGSTTVYTVFNAYLADCSDSGQRARIFSLFAGLSFAGYALGPSIGSSLIFLSHSLLSPFYLSLALNTSYALFALFLLPESVTPPARARSTAAHEARKCRSRLLYAERRQREADRRMTDPRGAEWMRVSAACRRWVRKLGECVRPLGMVLPVRREGGRWDYNLTLACMAYTLWVLNFAVFNFSFQYAMFRFGWQSEELGFFISFLNIARSVSLMIALPLVMKLLRPAPPQPHPHSRHPSTASSSHRPRCSSSPPRPRPTSFHSDATCLPYSRETPLARQTRLQDAHFDLQIVRWSVVLDVLAYVWTALASEPVSFAVASSLSTLAAGANPVIQALALGLQDDQANAGKLLGALSVLSSVSAQVLGPLLFGASYSVFMVKYNFPQGIFFVSATTFFLALLALLFIRVRPDAGQADVEEDAEDSYVSDCAR